MQNSLNLVKQLVHDFKSQQSYYLSPGYQEQEARKDFIDKFFMALGWDVNHERQKNPYEQEVRIEKSVKSGKTQRRADYAFYITPNFRDPKFFVEAKKPYLNLSDPDHYYQAIRYGWNKKIPISLLTDFEEFHILDCRFMPDIATIMSRKIEYIHYEQYADEETFARIFHLFGREAVANGSIEKFAASLPKPKGKAVQQALFKTGYKPIDEAFLERLDEYRLILAKSFKKHNQQLESEELTEAVQRTIDRLVFIRFLEDKSIEESRIEHLGAEPNAWKAFAQLCRSLEPKYNGLVFKPHPVIDGKDFIPPDDREFVDICDELSHEKSPYLFDEIPISILGNIYERFLGKVVHATPKRADVEEKPEVRKAGGVYYTPEYIVRYIVSNTVGKLIEGKTPDEIAPMAFADIACGSGSFLIEVYSELLEYHERWYNENPGKAKPADIQNRDGRLVLSLKKRQEILTNNIYGVDIDFQATEVTQLSLYLKLLEDVTMNDAYQFSLIKEKILPDLRNNIVCGNSLIGTDILDGDLFDRTEEHKLNPMNFEDAFPKVMRRGGFDAIVGNPPYVRIQSLEKIQANYYFNKYSVAKGNADLYVNFVEKGFNILNQNGFLGFILPNKFLKTDYGIGLRSFISLNSSLYEIVDFGAFQVFNATTYTCLLYLKKSRNDVFKYAQSEANSNSINSLKFQLINNDILKNEIWLFESQNTKIINSKLELNSTKLIDIPTEISRGSSSGDDNVFMVDENIDIEDEILKIPIFSTDFNRYDFKPEIKWKIIFPYHKENNKYVLYTENELKNKFPKAYTYLKNNQIQLKKRKQYQIWFGYSATRNLELHEKAQIIIPLLANKGLFAFIPENIRSKICLMASGGFSIMVNPNNQINPYYVLGLINSKLLFWKLNNISNIFRGGWITCTKQYFGTLPIKTIDFTNPADKARHDQIVSFVEKILSAKEQLSHAKTDAERTRLEMLCNSLDRQIDQAVYELYGLTEEEIKVVEGG